MMNNHPFIVWSSCFLWFTSIFSITWSIILFCSMGDMMELTGLDVMNSFVLLSGIIMIPMNIQMLFYIANGKRISRDSDVICCPLWLCALWIILINVAASLLCARKISWCRQNTDSFIEESMKYYRSCPKYKRFMDNIQWSLKCCGLESFRDWFSYDWYDKIRDYEWDPSLNRRKKSEEISSLTSDSVPLRYLILSLTLIPACCKSGSCISNYLMELGTHSINTQGCGANLHKVIMITLITHLTLFLIVIIDEILLLKYIMKQDRPCNDPYVRRRSAVDVRQIMIAKDNFDASSRSSQINPDDSDEDPYPNIKK